MVWKQAYQEKVAVQLQEWETWIASMKDAATPLTQQQCSQFARLEEYQLAARARLQELAEASDRHWELVRQSVERAMIDFKRAFDQSGLEFPGSVIPLQPSRAHMYEPFQRKGQSFGFYRE